MKHTTQTATVKEMRTLANTAKKHSEDAANSWQQVHNLTAAAHSAANRAATCALDAESAVNRAAACALDAESAAHRAATCARWVKICTLLNLLAFIALAVFTIGLR